MLPADVSQLLGFIKPVLERAPEVGVRSLLMDIDAVMSALNLLRFLLLKDPVQVRAGSCPNDQPVVLQASSVPVNRMQGGFTGVWDEVGGFKLEKLLSNVRRFLKDETEEELFKLGLVEELLQTNLLPLLSSRSSGGPS
jgi:hypothetical protein